MAETLKDYVDYLVNSYFEVDGIDVYTDISTKDRYKFASLLFDRDGRNLLDILEFDKCYKSHCDDTFNQMFLFTTHNSEEIIDHFSVMTAAYYFKEMQQLIDHAHAEELANRDMADNLNRRLMDT